MAGVGIELSTYGPQMHAFSDSCASLIGGLVVHGETGHVLSILKRSRQLSTAASMTFPVTAAVVSFAQLRSIPRH